MPAEKPGVGFSYTDISQPGNKASKPLNLQ
jgi:hypothetical protein